MAESQCSAFAHEFDIVLDGSSSLVFDFIRFHEGTTSTVFGESEGLGKASLPHADLCGSCRNLQARANVRFAWRVVLRVRFPARTVAQSLR